MFQKQQMIIMMSVFGLVLASLIGCQWWDRDDRTPTTPARGDSFALTNYAQMDGGSTVVDGQQINWYVSEWGSFPYGYWKYVEVNQQDAIGQSSGEHQVPVTLGNVVLHFSDLPDEVTQIMIGVKVVHDDNDDTFTERGPFDVVDGSVNIPLAYADLVYYFGETHYSIWFQAIGGKNGEGTVCGNIALSGVMPDGQSVNLSKRVCFGTDPASKPLPALAPASTCGGTDVGGYCWYYGNLNQSCAEVCIGHGGYNDATRTYAGSAGIFTRCIDVLTALGQGTGTWADGEIDVVAIDLGCHFVDYTSIGGSSRRARDTTAGGDSETDKNPWQRRACACNQ